MTQAASHSEFPVAEMDLTSLTRALCVRRRNGIYPGVDSEIRGYGIGGAVTVIPAYGLLL